jgi:hypothetical protein
MKVVLWTGTLALITALTLTSPAAADFSGQTILGPLGPGDVVNGNTIGATDDNDGITSGMHIFFIWNGPDDVWAINWPGGDLSLTMTYDTSTGEDVDLFLYTPASLDDSGNFSIVNSGVEDIIEPGAAAGTYYVLVDSTDASTAGPYTLTVSRTAPPLCAGDTNCDGSVTFADIDGFVEALGGESAWSHLPCPWLSADCNQDGDVTFADIDPFVVLVGTTCP